MKERISLWQLFILAFISRSILALGGIPGITAGRAGRDIWISILIMTCVTGLILFAYTRWSSGFGGKTVVSYALERLGPVAGRVVTLPILWGLLHIAAIVLREYGEAVAALVLPNTPRVLTMGALVLVTARAVRGGVEVVARIAEVLFPLFLVTMLATDVLFVFTADFSLLTPVLAQGWQPVIRGTVVTSGIYLQALAFLILVSHANQPEKAARTATLGLISAGLFILVQDILVVATLSPSEAARYTFPFIGATRLINVVPLLQRVELLPLFAWGAGLYLQLNLLFYAGVKGVSDWMGMTQHRPLVYPMAAILLVLAFFLFENEADILAFQRPGVIGPYGMALLVVFPALVWLATSLVGTREPKGRGRA